MYLTVGKVSKVAIEEDGQSQEFQRQVVSMPGDKEVTLGPNDRKPLDPSLPSSPLYITLHNVTPGTNADVTLIFHSGGGPFGLGGAGYAVVVIIALVALALVGAVAYFVYQSQVVPSDQSEVKYDNKQQQQQQQQHGGSWNTGTNFGGSWDNGGGGGGGTFSQQNAPYDMGYGHNGGAETQIEQMRKQTMFAAGNTMGGGGNYGWNDGGGAGGYDFNDPYNQGGNGGGGGGYDQNQGPGGGYNPQW